MKHFANENDGLKVSKNKKTQGRYSLVFGLMLLFPLSQQAIAQNETIWTKLSCASQFYDNAPPYLVRDNLKKSTTALCFNGFNVMYSGISKTPFWSAEHLTPNRLSQKIKRQDSFHEEERVSASYRATLKDYRGSGYDRGHMSPNGDMPDEASQYDSFSLANMVPQAPKNNQEIWRMLEEATRGMVTKQNQDVYVVTGPIFSGKKLQTIGNSVFVPSAVFKAVYYPKTGAIGAYYAPNDNSLDVKVVSVCQIEALTGINLFPTLNDTVKRKLYDLPLSTADIKSSKPLYLKQDSSSECASSVSSDELITLRKQFSAPGRPDVDGKIDHGSNQSHWLVWIKSALLTLLEFLLKMINK